MNQIPEEVRWDDIATEDMKPIKFDELVEALRRDPVQLVVSSGVKLQIFDEKPLYVPQTLVPLDQGALSAEVILIQAHAAVGKSTLAKALSHACKAPLLDLATVTAGSGTLTGLLDSDLEGRGTDRLLDGDLVAIVDALDECKLLRGELAFWEFVETAVMRLQRHRVATDRPKLIMIGRPGAVEETRDVIKSYASDVKVSTLNLEYFGESESWTMVKLYGDKKAKEGSPYKLPGNASAVQGLTKTYFRTIARALNLEEEQLWSVPVGREFAGYAPLLRTVGELLADSDNFQLLQNEFEHAEPNNIWSNIETLAATVMERDRKEKVSVALAGVFGMEPPVEAYDIAEQYELLIKWAQGAEIQPSDRMKEVLHQHGLVVGPYLKTVNEFLDVHPFLRGRDFANHVIASLVLSRAILADLLVGDRGDDLLSDASRNPFLWRAFRSCLMNAEDQLVIEGRYLGYILASLANDNADGATLTAIRDVDGEVEVSFGLTPLDGRRQLSFAVNAPLRIYGRANHCRVQADVPLELVGYSRKGSPSVLRLRDVIIDVQKIDLVADVLYLEDEIWLDGGELVQPPFFEIKAGKISRVGWGQGFRSRWPWSKQDFQLQEKPGAEPEGDRLYDLLAAASRRITRNTLIVLKDDLTSAQAGEDGALNWFRREFGATTMRSFWKLLVQFELATVRPRISSGNDKLIVLTLNGTTWDGLVRSRRNPQEAESHVDGFLKAVENLLSS